MLLHIGCLSASIKRRAKAAARAGLLFGGRLLLASAAHRGMGFPSCGTRVALFDRTAPLRGEKDIVVSCHVSFVCQQGGLVFEW